MEYRPSRTYPTIFLQPTSTSRLVREVVWVEMEHLAQLRRQPDIVATMESIHKTYRVFQKLDYNVPELLSTFQQLDPYRAKSKKQSKLQLTPEMVPWETIPEELILKCLDDNMELQIVPELLQYLGISSGESQPAQLVGDSDSIFGRVKYTSRYVSPERHDIVRSPVYDKSGKRVATEYYFYDEELGDFRKAVVSKPGDKLIRRVHQEIDFVVEMFSPDNEWPLGMSQRLLAQTIWSLFTCVIEYRREYYKQSYLERLIKHSPEELKKERMKNEKEYAISRKGAYTEDTSVLWRYGQLSDP